SDPEYIVRWAWTTHHLNADRIAALAERRPNLSIVRLRSHRESARWFSTVLGRYGL
ncbi:MAG: adenylate kinase, partial [Pseudonocardiales bacterium]|nr:adenylate kinase [Pseudonocardiales bacterium]